MRQIKRPWESANFLFVLFITFPILLIHQSFAQGPTSSIGDRENIGIYGGPANDLTYVNTNERLFAGIQNPTTLMYSDDNGQNWSLAFPFDSLRYHLGERGWGGGAQRVISNQKGWVAVQTGFMEEQLSAAVISFDEGTTFKTAFDPFILNMLTGEFAAVTSIDLTDHFLYTSMGEYLLRMNDTMTFGTDMALLKIDTLSGFIPGSTIKWIAASNDISGFPLYFVIDNPVGNNRLFKYYGNLLFELFPPTIDHNLLNVFTHPGQISADTVFISSFNTVSQGYEIHKSYFGGFGWTPVFVPGISQPLSDADYSPDWVSYMPLSNGLRLSFPGGLISDDLGDTWQGPGLLDYGIATNPYNIDLILGSNNIGVAVSNTGIIGTFMNTSNIGFTNVNVNQFAQSQGILYAATDAGLAYTQEYFNSSIVGYDQWIPPNGIFPVPNAGDEDGVTAVAVDPANSDHVICGYRNGFNTTFTGPNDFIPTTPPNWNANSHFDPWVTDIHFITSNIVIATTGFKHKSYIDPQTQVVGNIWRSIDGGLNWTLVTPLFPDEFQMGNCIAVGTNGPQTIIYIGSGFDDELGNEIAGAIWISNDLGDTWAKINDAPIFGSPQPLPVYDIDIHPLNTDIIYLSAKNIFARSDNGGLSYFFTDVPYNTGSFTSALIDPQYPDSITITAGNNIYKYNYLIDDADLKFKGLPGEHFICSEFGSVLAGSETGGSKIIEATTYELELKAFIEGPFDDINLNMNTDLNTNGYLPLSQPFNQAPWFYNGTESVTSIPNPDIVDWVLVELRKTTGDSATATKLTQFNRQAAFLLKDGTIVEDDGISVLRFSIILSSTKGNDKVHGVVLSPSHTGERTSSEMSSAKASTFSYDFTTGPDVVYGGSKVHKELAPGIWGMISGDGNHDGIVGNRDKNDVWLPEYGNMGYYFGDFNRDGTVDETDIIDYWKSNAGRGNILD